MRSLWIAFAIACSMPPDPIPEPVPEPLEAPAPHEVAEAMLAHTVDSGVVRAYRRSDFLEQRRVLAERWADHVTGGDGRVVQLAGAVG